MENEIDLDAIPEIPHGHGLSFKKGVSDGLLANNPDHDDHPETHRASYRRGVTLGEYLKTAINRKIRS